MFRVFSLILLFLYLARFSAQDVTTEYKNNQSSVEEQNARVVRRKWISQIFDEVQSKFTMNVHVSEQCRNDYLMYETYLQNQTIWAIRMMESSEWPRLGLFYGVTTVLGDWSECLSVRSPNYQGQYCLVDAVYDYSFVQADPITRGWDRPANQNSSVWGVIKMYDKIITRISRRKLTWALCIPSTCKASDLESSITAIASTVFHKYGMHFEANVASRTCRVENPKTFSGAFWFTLCFLLFLGSVVLLATYFTYRVHLHILSEKEPVKEIVKDTYAMKVLSAFAIQRSYRYLTHSSPGTIYSLYFAKSLLFWFILCLHEGMLAIPSPKIEQEKTELMYQPWMITFGFHSAVDVFLAISGFLKFHLGYEPTKKDGISYFFRSILCRWARLIPVMGLFILVYVFIFPELGDGPLWNRSMPYEVQCCKSNWWANMLAIHNIVNRKDLCLPNTWYIAVDFQLTIIGSALLVILSKNFTLGIVSMILTLMTGIGFHFHAIYKNEFTGLPLPAAYEIEVMRKLPVFSDLYIQTYSRIGPYMVGFAGALLMRELKIRKYRPSLTAYFLLIGLTTFVGIGSQLFGFMFTILDRPYDPIENAIYGAFTRTLIAIPAVCAIILQDLRRMGWTIYILKWKVFLVMGRLAFVVYLCSYPIQLFRYSSMRQLLVGSSNIELAYSIMTNVCLTMIVAGCLFGLVEGPLLSLTKLIDTAICQKKKESDIEQSKTVRQW